MYHFCRLYWLSNVESCVFHSLVSCSNFSIGWYFHFLRNLNERVGGVIFLDWYSKLALLSRWEIDKKNLGTNMYFFHENLSLRNWFMICLSLFVIHVFYFEFLGLYHGKLSMNELCFKDGSINVLYILIWCILCKNNGESTSHLF